MQPQVLIVGAGPTGLVLALTLLKSGVPVRIIDKAREYHISSRGSGVFPRIQEIEHFLGTLADLQAVSMSAPLLHIYDPENPCQVKRSTPFIETMDPTPQSPISSLILVNQYLHEGVLRSHVEAYGGTIELGAELTKLEQIAHGVNVHLARFVDGEEIQESATFSYVVGADGGRSFVRKLLGLQFIGETHEQEKLFTADVDLKGLEGYGMHGFMNIPSLFLMIRSTNIPERFQILIGGHYYAGIADECTDAGLEEFQHIITRLTNNPDIQILKIHVKMEWTYNARMVDHFQKGRVFVAGDAAHAHSPMGGQGMTSSIQDAFNLAWKLALVIKGYASPGLLSSYEEERLPAISDMLLESSMLHRKAYGEKEKDKDASMQKTIDALGSAAAPLAAGSSQTSNGEYEDEEQGKRFFRGRKLFQLDLNYRWSPIVLDERFDGSQATTTKDAYGKTGHDIRAGDRAPDAPGLVVRRNGGAIVKVAGEQGEVVRLFDIFDPTAHTVLVFSSRTDASFVGDVKLALKKLPRGLVYSVLVNSQGSNPAFADDEADLALNDKEGYAYRGYGVDTVRDTIVIVRPDGMIGAFVKDAAGMERYFARVFTSA